MRKIAGIMASFSSVTVAGLRALIPRLSRKINIAQTQSGV
jgi:hypothetical protein